jgi:hypothetical protein
MKQHADTSPPRAGLALLVTIYATADMMMYNRKRRGEFLALQKQFKEDSLEAARLAYMTGKASEEQIRQVEEATDKARQAGMQLPPLLGPPQPAAAAHAQDGGPLPTTPTSVWPGDALVESNTSAAAEVDKPVRKGFTGWLFSGLKKEEVRDEPMVAGVPHGGPASDASSQSTLQDRAKAVFDQERENQRRGGPLDQLGTEAKGKSEGKKGWLW